MWQQKISGDCSDERHFGIFLLLSGKDRSAFKISSEALRIAEESGDIYSKGDAYISAWDFVLRERTVGRLHKTISQRGSNCVKGSITILGMRMHEFHLGEIYFEMGDFAKSKEHYRKRCWVLEKMRIISLLGESCEE